MLSSFEEDFIEAKEANKPIQPVPLLILDVNMPFNGLESIKNIKKLYRDINEKLHSQKTSQEEGEDKAEKEIETQGDIVIRPLICYLS